MASMPLEAKSRSWSTERSNAPVFVVGCPRSGTTLLYHMLLSTGTFAMYTTESQAFTLLEPRFGDLKVERNRHRLLKEWGKSSLFTCTGLNLTDVERATKGCQNAGEFLRVVMDLMVRAQGMKRWAECTPDHLLALPRIQETIPEALVIHIIRDGRDVALSLAKQRWIRPLPWDREEFLPCAALYWEWIVNRGRTHGKAMAGRYKEICYEDLINEPDAVLGDIGDFIGQRLDYAQIKTVGLGSIRRPNSSFGKNDGSGEFRPVARWKKSLAGSRLEQIENLIGATLSDLGYPLTQGESKITARLKRKRIAYRCFFSSKRLLKNRTPLGGYCTCNLRFLGLEAAGPSYAPDALREPIRIVQIVRRRHCSESDRDLQTDIRKELRRRGHFLEVLRSENQYRDQVPGTKSASFVGELWDLTVRVFRGYRLNPHINNLSRRDCCFAIFAAALGRTVWRPVFITFTGNVCRLRARTTSRVLDRMVFALLNLAGEFSCDHVEVRDAITEFGIASDKIRFIKEVHTAVDWLTGDLLIAEVNAAPVHNGLTAKPQQQL
jgi:hypothetical protein